MKRPGPSRIRGAWRVFRQDLVQLLEGFHGTLSLPFKPGDNRCLAIKIVDDRGIESLKVIRLD